MNIEKINWDYDSEPQCNNGDVVVLVQYGEAEIAKYVCPKPKGASVTGGNFMFEMCANEDGLEEDIFMLISKLYPEIEKETDKPLLFLCPDGIAKRTIWD